MYADRLQLRGAACWLVPADAEPRERPVGRDRDEVEVRLVKRRPDGVLAPLRGHRLAAERGPVRLAVGSGLSGPGERPDGESVWNRRRRRRRVELSLEVNVACAWVMH